MLQILMAIAVEAKKAVYGNEHVVWVNCEREMRNWRICTHLGIEPEAVTRTAPRLMVLDRGDSNALS